MQKSHPGLVISDQKQSGVLKEKAQQPSVMLTWKHQSKKQSLFQAFCQVFVDAGLQSGSVEVDLVNAPTSESNMSKHPNAG